MVEEHAQSLVGIRERRIAPISHWIGLALALPALAGALVAEGIYYDSRTPSPYLLSESARPESDRVEPQTLRHRLNLEFIAIGVYLVARVIGLEITPRHTRGAGPS